jgi:peptide/nickel transport system ATP-binding protein
MNPAGLPGDPPDPQHVPSGCPFHVRCPSARAECETIDIELRPAGDGRRSACILAGVPAP